MVNKILPFLIASIFLIVAIAWDFHSKNSFSNESIALEIGNNLNRELAALGKEAIKISTDTGKLDWSSLHYSFYYLNKGRIVSWSKNDFAIDASDFAGDFKFKLLQTAREDLLLCKFPQTDPSLIGIIPLRIGFEIVNRYLTTTWNERVFPVQGLKILAVNAPEGSAVCTTAQQCVFKVQLLDGVFFENFISLVITLVAIAFTLVGVYFIVIEQHRKRNYFHAFLILFGTLAAIRIAMVSFLFPGRWVYAEFFDPKYFASSSFNASVGDFLLNALIVTIPSGYLFKIYSRLDWVRNSKKRDDLILCVISVLLLTASFFSFLFPHLFVESIFHDSAISIDITSESDWDLLRVMALIALLLGYLSSFFFVHILVRWAKFLTRSRRSFLINLAISGMLFAGYFLFSELNYWPTFFIGLPFIFLLYSSKYFRSISVIGYQTFSFLLIVVIAYAAQGAFGIWRFAEEKEVRSMFRAASNLINRDVLGEYLLNEAVKKITADEFIASSMGDVLTQNTVRQKVREIHLNSYFDRYEVMVSLYNTDSSSVVKDGENFKNSISALVNESNKTAYEGIYFIRNSKSESVKRYLAVVPVKRAHLVGYIVLDLSSKQIIPQQVYPELLVDNRFSQSLRDKNFSYAFYKQKKIIGSIGSFNFDREFNVDFLTNSILYSKGMIVNGNWLVGAEDETGKGAIISAEAYPPFFSIANFSFLFVLGISLIFISLIVYLTGRWRNGLDLNYSARIQLYIYLSFILPLLVVSTIALRMISQSEEVQLEKEIKEKGLRITENMADLLSHTPLDNLDSSNELQKWLGEVAQNTFTDVNFYLPSGDLRASSQPTIFNSKLVMPLPDRASWKKIIEERFNIVQARCRIGLLEYNSLFFAVRQSGKNRLDGILELPFFQSNSQAAKASVLANILVTFVIVFILFSFFAFNAIAQLTSPLKFIAKKLKTTSLGNNQPIEWNSNDEIGLMVKEYNRMLSNLEKNRVDLARVQKESAWREIAQQVAHEIKNPLTPMKLTLQQLENVFSDRKGEDRTKKSVQMLLAQVEILNGIAGSFSAFAMMPSPDLKRIDLSLLLENTVGLFKNQYEGCVKLKKPLNSIFVLGDDHLLGRIFSNIILNGLQSRSEEQQIIVEITEQPETSECIVCFRDNGFGIPKELNDKIFIPHFSTKQTGSGLGLAIAKQGIEQMSGTIWFETSEGKGSTFFIKLKMIV